MFSLKRLAEHPSIRDPDAKVRLHAPLSPRGTDFSLAVENDEVKGEGLRTTRFVERGSQMTFHLFAIAAGVAAIWAWFIWTEMAAATSMLRMGEWFVPAVLRILAVVAAASAGAAVGRLRTRREVIIDWQKRTVTVTVSRGRWQQRSEYPLASLSLRTHAFSIFVVRQHAIPSGAVLGRALILWLPDQGIPLSVWCDARGRSRRVEDYLMRLPWQLRERSRGEGAWLSGGFLAVA